MTHAIRTKKQPWLVLHVEENEYVDLQRQGLLIEEPEKLKDVGRQSASSSTGREN